MFAPDGSPVEVFQALPAGPAPAMIASVLPPGATVLDLGAGAGRLCTALAAHGFHATAVDVSPEMLAGIAAPVTTVCAAIEGLDLRRRFDAVILASYLVNHPSAREYLVTCARHLGDGGVVMVQRYDPLWIRDATPDTATAGNVTIAVERVAVDESADRFTMDVTYGIDDREWSQQVHALIVGDEHMAGLAAGAGLRVEGWLDEYRTWALLRRSA